MHDSAHAPDSFTLRNVHRAFPEWHKGRTDYCLWALDVDQAAVRRRMAAAQAHLAELLLGHYRRQAHVTLGLCGFPCHSATHADDFSADMLQRQIDALRRAHPKPFHIEIGHLATFRSAPYLTVHEDGRHIPALRHSIATGALDQPLEQYVPHVTVGLYRDAWPLSEVQGRLDNFTIAAPLSVRISGISLLSYQPAQIGGPLRRLARYDFANQHLQWERKSPLLR